MKNNLNFTRGEWVAALVLLAVILASYIIYYMYDIEKTPPVDMSGRAEVLVAFNERQAALKDSMEEAYKLRYERRPYACQDTNPKFKKTEKKPMYEIVKIDLNHCDTNDIVVVPTFGSKRAARLVEYRDRVGGFYSLEQLREVYVLQNIDMALMEKYFWVRANDVRKININTASYKELSSHPYFDAYLTKTIINYRTKNGKIDSFEKLQQITHAYPELMDKLKHYVVF